jgi:hypothetical protein
MSHRRPRLCSDPRCSPRLSVSAVSFCFFDHARSWRLRRLYGPLLKSSDGHSDFVHFRGLFRVSCGSLLRRLPFKPLPFNFGDLWQYRQSWAIFAPTPCPLCTPNSTQGHPRHPRIGRGSWVLSQVPSTKNQISALALNVGDVVRSRRSLPSPLAPTRIPKGLTKVIPMHSNLAWVSASFPQIGVRFRDLPLRSFASSAVNGVLVFLARS